MFIQAGSRHKICDIQAGSQKKFNAWDKSFIFSNKENAILFQNSFKHKE